MSTDPATEPLASVLVAAPDPDLRHFLRYGLAGLAAEVLEVADGREGLDRLAKRTVELVIADRQCLARVPGTSVKKELIDALESQEIL